MKNEVAVREYNQLMPATLADKMKMADVLSKSGLMPSTLDTPQKVFIALQMGHELGVPPMVAVNNIGAVNGKPVISADLQVAVARQHPEFGGMEVKDDGQTCTVTVRRVGKHGTETFQGSFSMADAEKAALTGKDNWKKYAPRMRKHRATAFALRDAFPDALAGFYTGDEMESSEPRVVQSEADDAAFTVTSTEQPAKEEPTAEPQPSYDYTKVQADAIAAAKKKVASGAITESAKRQWWDEMANAKDVPSLRGIIRRIESLKDPAPKDEPDDGADLDEDADAGWDEANDKQNQLPVF